MGRFFSILIILFILYVSGPIIKQKFASADYVKEMNQVESKLNDVINNPGLQATIDSLSDGMKQLIEQLGLFLDKQQKEEPQDQKKITVHPPSNQVFSVHNIELGATKEGIEHIVGQSNRETLNEYGAKWYAYHTNYQNFFMIMYDDKNRVAGLYTNQDLISSNNGIKLGSSKETVRAALGEPLTGIQKGLTVFQLQENADYDVYLLDEGYVTIFYDKHENNTVTAMQLINKEMEQKKHELYTSASPALKEGFELQLFDLTNASRVEHQLPILSWDDHVRETARKHSTDMAVNHYFDHTNLKGQSPFDRMKEDHIIFYLAGENLAYGQFSSIFAHEGLMNSLGHRENILRKGYKYLGVGVAFNDQSQPYYTENFYAK
ncbi:CAP domain-containing protein [Neobacillus sp. MM2021_6]|uniref:CAP domain-containing protein n=1 Tax=Bacillaceae TaxID=186817 RepID=UPI00140D04BD|nr:MULTISPECIES: CAP domain-containing protein [Bacillaceae]MBO0961704.1 CAP domain-containing protein [Neobacillus sp. MM2021_6]NHC18295.1 CAP domain-containing protein [Bacillus sp. MM2020_4]